MLQSFDRSSQLLLESFISINGNRNFEKAPSYRRVREVLLFGWNYYIFLKSRMQLIFHFVDKLLSFESTCAALYEHRPSVLILILTWLWHFRILNKFVHVSVLELYRDQVGIQLLQLNQFLLSLLKLFGEGLHSVLLDLRVNLWIFYVGFWKIISAERTLVDVVVSQLFEALETKSVFTG